ncbi:ABC transporter ATP-binding protein [Marispirochaeta aestuarii]|uniref:ABC transporter ATP-binding protein n=1 Tax=Marispirochaeta aestuarii TaxID=1963862 RepID=UPI0029C96407|nr:ABC transporter ATP-binding protein [Marispirochaeta aestuarii]
MIEVRDIVKDYRSGETLVHALRSLSIDIGKGEFTSIAGPSGSGKTTLLNLIGCIDSADGGEILINKEKVSRMNKKELAAFRRDNLGFIFQTFNLIPVLTAYENVAFALNLLKLGNGEVRERSMQILREVGLEGMEDRRPSQLSGGQQQRVAVARALVKNPAIILADEPTANLDSETGRSVLELMEEMNRKHGTTFIFSTHDKMVMDFARRLVRLQDGRIIEDSGGRS